MTNIPTALNDVQLSIVVPVFNEKANIGAVLNRLLNLQLPLAFEIVVVDDGSADGSAELARGMVGDARLRVICEPVNRGKGAAVRVGVAAARGEFVIIQDADLELDPGEIGPLIDLLMRHPSEAVYGSRFLRAQKDRIPIAGHLGNRALTFVTNVLYGGAITDMETCYKAMRRSVFLSLDLHGERFEIEPEITAKLFLQGRRILEVPVTYSPRSRSAGKKIRATDGVLAIIMLFRLRFPTLASFVTKVSPREITRP
jgi:glycosyltransferase involved in cell wall biosynthesis